MAIDNSFSTAFEVFGPVFLFGPDIIEGQNAASELVITFRIIADVFLLQSCVLVVSVSFQ